MDGGADHEYQCETIEFLNVFKVIARLGGLKTLIRGELKN